MNPNYLKELTPVLYNSSGLKTIKLENLPPNFIVCHMHWHERMELLLVTSGSLFFRLKNYETILTENQLAIIPPGQLHCGTASEMGISFETIMFDVNAFYNALPITERYLKPVFEQKITFLPWTEQPEIIALVKSLLKESHPEESLSSLYKVGQIYELIALLYRHCLAEDGTEVASPNQFQDVLNYINLHFHEEISSDQLSKKFGYSEGYFCRQFKAVTGLTPMSYIRILRLEKAQEMLQKKPVSFSEVANQCGFSNANYFTRCFKSHYHLTPTEYIQRQEEKRKIELHIV